MMINTYLPLLLYMLTSMLGMRFEVSKDEYCLVIFDRHDPALVWMVIWKLEYQCMVMVLTASL